MNMKIFLQWFPPLPEIFDLVRIRLFVLSIVLFAAIIFLPELLANPQIDNEAFPVADESSSLLFTILIITGVVGLAAFIVFALISWGRKQDDIDNMMSFCVKYFFDTTDKAEKCKAASALGKTKNIGALLVLVDVVNDEKIEKSVREAAEKALAVMSSRYTIYRNAINELISGIKYKDHQKVIDILISNFEKDGGSYAQSAYVIGREFIRLKQYDVGREWLHKAQIRNQKFDMYGSQITLDINKCNEHLFANGDARFKEGDYYGARELYTLASTGIEEEDKKHFAAYLRLACVYCKVGDYVDADQAILQALQHRHKTDLSLRLNKLIAKILDIRYGNPNAEAETVDIKKEIDRCIKGIMDELSAR